MKFKNKIITLCLSALLFFTSAIPSSASTIVAGGVISYELLMGLMSVGVAFGLSLPKDNDQYWDYVRSLKDHLTLVDDDYLENLEKSYKEWKSNNNNKPNNEKEPLKLPYIPSLDELFSNVGNDVSNSNPKVYDTYGSYTLVKYGETMNNFGYNFRYKLAPATHNFHYKNANGETVTLSASFEPSTNNRGYINTTVSVGDKSYTVKGSRYYNDTVFSFKFVQEGNLVYPYIGTKTSTGYGVAFNGKDFGIYDTNKVFSQEDVFKSTTAENFGELAVQHKTEIEYTQTQPNFDSEGNIELDPSKAPNDIEIPNKDTWYGNDVGLEPPFEVDKSPVQNPGENPGENPGDDSDADTDVDADKGLINLIVPSSNYWNNKFNETFDHIGNNFPMLDINSFKSLCVNGVPPKDINVTIMGSTGKIFDTKYLNGIIDWLHPITSAFMAFLLMLYNYRKVYKLIRGFEPFGGIAEGQSVGEVKGKMDGAMPEMSGSSFVGPSSASTWSDGQSVTRGSIQSRYYGRDL